MRKCPVCGTPATDNDVFCSGCGQRLPAPTAPSADAPVSASPPLPPMPGPPPIAPSGSPQRSQAAPTPRQQTQVVQPSYQQPATASYGQSQPQQPPVIQPPYGQATPVYGQPPAAAQPPKKKISGCLIAIIVVVVLALCGGVVVAGIAIVPGLLPSATPTLTPYSGGNNTGSTSGETSLDVVNNLNVAICYLYISPSTSDDWGEDWLGDTDTIEPGVSATFYLPVGETVDMQAEDCDGAILDTQYDVYVTDEGLTYTLSP